ncbi:TolB family protein [Paenibacillus pinihumi]|uniref:TolB family protein n=1 Tax=Paenibacillus pinihumi TaxID=669462 RepID=UPI00041CC469|nr:hypothetical protein [Paenibacillus pinihumi]
MNKEIQQAILVAGLVAVIGLLPGCGLQSNKGEAVTPLTSGATLTVKDMAVEQSAGKVEVSQIERIENTSGMAWLSDKQVLLQQEEIRQQGKGKEPFYSHTSVIYNVDTKAKTPWEWGEGTVWLSPDGKHAFIAEAKTSKYNLSGQIINLINGLSQAVKLELGIVTAGWADNNTLLLSVGHTVERIDIPSGNSSVISLHGGEDSSVTGKNEKENIYLVDGVRKIKRSLVEIKKHGSGSSGYGSDYSLIALYPIKDTIYYIDDQFKLKSIPIKGGEPSVLAANIIEAAPSPDGSRVALVQQIGETEMLVLADSHGNIQGDAVARGNLIQRLSWSPDMKVLLFSVYSEAQGGMNGLYAFDLEAGKVTALADIQSLSYPIRWAPGSRQFMITDSETRDGQYRTVTSIFKM